MALVCKSSPLRQIHSLQQKLFYSFEWLYFKGRWKQQPHAVSHVWTLLMNYLSKQGLKGVLRQSRVLQWKREGFSKVHYDSEDSPNALRYHPSQTPVSVQMCLQSGFAYSLLRNLVMFILQKHTGSLNMRLLLPEERAIFLPHNIILKPYGKAFLWHRQNIIFCLTKGPGP